MNVTTPYYKLILSSNNQMQENQLLHLIHNPLPFSREIIKYYDEEICESVLLLKTAEEEYSLKNILLKLNAQSQDKEKYNHIIQHIVQQIIIQLMQLEESLFEPNLNFLIPNMMYISTDYRSFILNDAISKTIEESDSLPKKIDDLNHLTWFILPKELHFLENAILTEKNLWQFLYELNPDEKSTYQSLESLILDKKYQIALQRYSKPEITNSHQIENLKTNTQVKTKNKLKSQKNIAKTPYFKKVFNQFKYKIKKSDIEQRDITIPLNLQQDVFRIAMLSEGAPGTIEENQGLRVFILVDEFLVGRDKTICDLTFDEKTIGRTHARITRHSSHYFIEDLGSKNGTFLDGKKLNKFQTYLLPEQCRLKFAEQYLYFIID